MHCAITHGEWHYCSKAAGKNQGEAAAAVAEQSVRRISSGNEPQRNLFNGENDR
jgi:hypothetical protein